MCVCVCVCVCNVIDIDHADVDHQSRSLNDLIRRDYMRKRDCPRTNMDVRDCGDIESRIHGFQGLGI